MKRRLFNIAWSVAKHFSSFSEALVYAWKLVKLQVALCLGVVKFSYKKVDGSVREAYGTLRDVPATKGNGSAKGVLTYFDTVADGWRSCKLENLIF